MFNKLGPILGKYFKFLCVKLFEIEFLCSVHRLSQFEIDKMAINKSSVNINEDLAKERLKCNFDLEEVTNILDGGKENTIKRRKIGKNYIFHVSL